MAVEIFRGPDHMAIRIGVCEVCIKEIESGYWRTSAKQPNEHAIAIL